MRNSYHTQQRCALLAFLSAHADEQFTVEQLLAAMGDAAPGRSTVYRALDRLVEEGTVRRFAPESGGSAAYQAMDPGHCDAHLHLKCVGCGRLIHLDTGVSDALQADLLRIPVDRPEMVETTAFGAAALAGLSCGVWSGLEELTRLRRSQRVFLPTRPQADCDRDYRLWKRAVSRASDWIEH